MLPTAYHEILSGTPRLTPKTTGHYELQSFLLYVPSFLLLQKQQLDYRKQGLFFIFLPSSLNMYYIRMYIY